MTTYDYSSLIPLMRKAATVQGYPQYTKPLPPGLIPYGFSKDLALLCIRAFLSQGLQPSIDGFKVSDTTLNIT
jgi:hypothetical protein